MKIKNYKQAKEALFKIKKYLNEEQFNYLMQAIRLKEDLFDGEFQNIRNSLPQNEEFIMQFQEIFNYIMIRKVRGAATRFSQSLPVRMPILINEKSGTLRVNYYYRNWKKTYEALEYDGNQNPPKLTLVTQSAERLEAIEATLEKLYLILLDEFSKFEEPTTKKQIQTIINIENQIKRICKIQKEYGSIEDYEPDFYKIAPEILQMLYVYYQPQVASFFESGQEKETVNINTLKLTLNHKNNIL